MPLKRKVKNPVASADRNSIYSKARQEQLRLQSQKLAAGALTRARLSSSGIFKAFVLLMLTAVCSSVTRRSLFPVYGSIPASFYHAEAIGAVFILAWSASTMFTRWMVSKHLARCLPLIAFWIPTIQYFMFVRSSELGAIWGPLITQSVSFYPLLLCSAVVAAAPLDYFYIGRNDSPNMERVIEAVAGSVLYSIFRLTDHYFSASVLPRVIGLGPFFTTPPLQILIASVFALLVPSRLLFLVIPSLIHSAFFNLHMPFPWTTAALNTTLQTNLGYSLLARQESLTGYISVLDNEKDHFRVLRCDHSVLGGDWLRPPPGHEHTSKVREPVYSVFVMLEAIRLIEVDSSTPRDDVSENALVIGLGIGTSATALIAHGINTTTVEIDPVIRDYAIEYFALPKNHNSVIQDALTFVDENQNLSFNYIIHDVFTGGAEPIDLFTYEFLSKVAGILKPDGAIAINFAGDVASPTAQSVVQTVKAVFPSCRIFREDKAPEVANVDGDFTNMVIFCIKASSAFSFRKPVEADFLESHARRHYLLPEHEVSLSQYSSRGSKGVLLREGNADVLGELQKESAVNHWSIMRNVLPHRVWENW